MNNNPYEKGYFPIKKIYKHIIELFGFFSKL